MSDWTGRYRIATVAWDAEPLDPFFNANTIEDLAEAERLAAHEARLKARHGRSARLPLNSFAIPRQTQR